jgi:hypothetical protein
LRELLECDSATRLREDADGPAYTPMLFATLLLIYIVLLTALPVIHEILEFLVR